FAPDNGGAWTVPPPRAAMGIAGRGFTKKRAGVAAAFTAAFSAAGAAAAVSSDDRVAAPNARHATASPNTLTQTPISSISICESPSRRHRKARRGPERNPLKMLGVHRPGHRRPAIMSLTDRQVLTVSSDYEMMPGKRCRTA